MFEQIKNKYEQMIEVVDCNNIDAIGTIFSIVQNCYNELSQAYAQSGIYDQDTAEELEDASQAIAVFNTFSYADFSAADRSLVCQDLKAGILEE